MNTIRRPRRRPRKRSVNFKTLGWLLVREAALRILMEPAIEARVLPWREGLCTLRTYAVISAAMIALDEHPERRYYP